MVYIRLRPPYPTPVRIEQEAMWASDPVWVFGDRKISGLFRNSNPWLSSQHDVVAPAPLLREPVPIISVEQRISWETNAYSGIDGICCLVCNLKVRNRVHKNLPMDPTLSYMNTIHILHTISLNYILILFSHLRLGIPNVLPLSQLSTNNSHVYLSHGSYIPSCPILFALITLTCDSWWPVCPQIRRLLIIKFLSSLLSRLPSRAQTFCLVVSCDCEQWAPVLTFVPLCSNCFTLYRGSNKSSRNVGS